MAIEKDTDQSPSEIQDEALEDAQGGVNVNGAMLKMDGKIGQVQQVQYDTSEIGKKAALDIDTTVADPDGVEPTESWEKAGFLRPRPTR